MTTPGQPLVLIRWLDAVASVGWESLEAEATTDLECWTVGWLVYSDESRHVVATTVGRDGECNARIVIPVGMVQEFKLLDGGIR